MPRAKNAVESLGSISVAFASCGSASANFPVSRLTTPINWQAAGSVLCLHSLFAEVKFLLGAGGNLGDASVQRTLWPFRRYCSCLGVLISLQSDLLVGHLRKANIDVVLVLLKTLAFHGQVIGGRHQAFECEFPFYVGLS